MQHRKVAMVVVAGCAAIMLSRGGVRATAEYQNPAAQAKPQAAMADKCKAMMADHQKMMADMKAADERLDGLVTKMNAATGQAKIDATAATVNEIVVQRKSMRDGMAGMQQGMMGHMMEHTQAGSDSTGMCPMMKMGGMKH